MPETTDTFRLVPVPPLLLKPEPAQGSHWEDQGFVKPGLKNNQARKGHQLQIPVPVLKYPHDEDPIDFSANFMSILAARLFSWKTVRGSLLCSQTSHSNLVLTLRGEDVGTLQI